MPEVTTQQLAAAQQSILARVSTLPEAEQDKIDATYKALFNLMAATGDAGRVALVLFQFDYKDEVAPYGDHFTNLEAA